MTIARPADKATAVFARFQGPVAPGAPLLVGEGEAAVFMRAGQPIRDVWTGSYQVPAEYAGDGVEVIFVTTRPIYGEKFGGIIGEMPGRGATQTKAFGEFAFRVTGPSLFLTSVVGSSDDSDRMVAWLREKVLSYLRVALVKHGAGMPASMEAVHAEVSQQAQELAQHGLALGPIQSLTVM